jgi:hypothetical protein
MHTSRHGYTREHIPLAYPLRVHACIYVCICACVYVACLCMTCMSFVCMYVFEACICIGACIWDLYMYARG